MAVAPDWPSIDAAQRRDAQARVPFAIVDQGTVHRVGSVRRDHLPALRAWPQWLAVADDSVTLQAAPPLRYAALAEMNLRLREAGHILAWRDEVYPLHDPASGRLLATFERAASRFWGTLTFGAHCNGYLADAQGRPTHLWIARRSFSKPTDPGRLDNLVGGGVPHGQTPAQTLLREAWEEAGLQPALLQALAAGRVVALHRDIAEGVQQEHLHVFDLALPADFEPCNQDGEVAEWHRLPVAQALAQAAGDTMTVDASLATLDFALRHGLIDEPARRAIDARSRALWCPREAAERFFAFNQTETPGQGG
jgi:8-oxo-dGTP pyrophosphatase MutT (NUDIX family)